ncbi:hypothetical protein EA473_03545 [Natrarchaeobius chitinivorans]|uniref:Uncharacterized protein n=2 Tax=Natrarchaeobius chitinivorans TaxID=1679083 RepID=A0A3N6MM78_NATCH|nr:hypothetical protein EA473_03545 [Natrarchaeobius chitinivorans]
MEDEMDVAFGQATIFVLVDGIDDELEDDDELDDDNGVDDADDGLDDDENGVDDADDDALDDDENGVDDADDGLDDENGVDDADDDAIDENGVDDEHSQVTIDQATIFVVHQLEDVHEEEIPEDDDELDDDNGVDDADDDALDDDNGVDDADDDALDDEDVGEDDESVTDAERIEVTIEQANIFVLEESPDEPVEEEPVDDEEPVEEEPVDDEEPVEEEPVDEEEPMSFTVDALEAPQTAEVGETITVTATVTNPGETEDTQDVQFRLEGDLLASQEVTLDAGETDDVVFDVETDGLEAGEYIHMVLTDEFGEVAILELTDEPVDEEPVEEEEPVDEEPVDEEPVDEEPVDEEPVDEEPVDEEPVEEEEPIDDEPVDEEEPDEADEPQPAHVTFSDQTTDGQTVVVDEVTMASGGFVAIHDSSLLVGNVLGSVIGSSEYLEAGTHENVEITLDEPLEEDETLIAMPHRDTNDNQEFDFVESEGEADGPYEFAGEPITDEAVVTLEAADEPEQEEEPTEDDTDAADDENGDAAEPMIGSAA